MSFFQVLVYFLNHNARQNCFQYSVYFLDHLIVMLAVLKFLFALNQDLGQILSNLDLEPTLRLKYDRVLFEQFDAEK